MNVDKTKRQKWDVNEKIKKKRLINLVNDLITEKNIPSKIEIIDLHDVNPKDYNKSGEDYQIKYKW